MKSSPIALLSRASCGLYMFFPIASVFWALKGIKTGRFPERGCNKDHYGRKVKWNFTADTSEH